MINKKKIKIIGLIPAKKNSRDFKNKNIKKLNNLSLYEIALLSSIKSKIIQKTYLSSDSSEILKRGKKFGAIPIKREKKFSNFKASANQLILDFIKKNINDHKKKEYIIVYLQPTSPFRNHKHIDSALNIFIKKKFKILFSVTENKHFFKSFKLNQSKINPYFENKLVTYNRQKLKKIYSPNGAIYIFYVKDFLTNKKINFANSNFFLMNKIDSIDIDSLEDYKLAKFLSKKFLKYKK